MEQRRSARERLAVYSPLPVPCDRAHHEPLGVGLTVSPEEVSLDLGPEGPSITHAPQGGDGWQLALLDLEGYRIGLAAGPDSEPLELRVRRADGSHLIESAARSQ